MGYPLLVGGIPPILGGHPWGASLFCGGPPPHPGGHPRGASPSCRGPTPPSLGGHPREASPSFWLLPSIWPFGALGGGYPSQLRASARGLPHKLPKTDRFLKKYIKGLSTPWPGQFSNFWLLVGGIPPHPGGASLWGIPFLWGTTPHPGGHPRGASPSCRGPTPPWGGILTAHPLLCGVCPQFGHLGL